jgi:hypothetical protein
MIKKDNKQKKFMDTMNPDAVMDQLDIERQMWRALPANKRWETIIDLAKKMRAKFRSDPFIYNKVVSLMMGDIWTPEDVRAQLKGTR